MKTKTPTETENMTKIGVWVTKEQRAKLDHLQEKYGTPLSESVRRALDAYLAKQR